jgi:hypothetical protein
MSTETKKLGKEYEELIGNFPEVPPDDREIELNKIRKLEDQLLLAGDILASETLLPGKEVFVRQGTGGESSQYYSGEVKEVLSDARGNPSAILLTDGTEVPFHPNITHISLIRKN